MPREVEIEARTWPLEINWPVDFGSTAEAEMSRSLAVGRPTDVWGLTAAARPLGTALLKSPVAFAIGVSDILLFPASFGRAIAGCKSASAKRVVEEIEGNTIFGISWTWKVQD